MPLVEHGLCQGDNADNADNADSADNADNADNADLSDEACFDDRMMANGS